MLCKPAAVGALVLALSACTTVTPKPHALLSDGLVVAASVCGPKNSVKATNDAPGKRAVCELETVVGTHVPKCVCRDEEQMNLDREETQQYLRDAQATKQNIRGG